MKWIQRGRRQKMGPPLESSPPISSVPSISPPPFQPVLALFISLWLHTISDEERLKKALKQGIQQSPSHPEIQPIYDVPYLKLFHLPTSFQLCPTYKWASSLKNLIIFHHGPTRNLASLHDWLFTWQAPLIPFHLPSLSTSVTEILDSFCSQDLLSDVLPESRRLRAQISWCIFQS